MHNSDSFTLATTHLNKTLAGSKRQQLAISQTISLIRIENRDTNTLTNTKLPSRSIRTHQSHMYYRDDEQMLVRNTQEGRESEIEV